MNLESLLQSPVFIFWIMPVLIFFARIIDVTIGTLRIVFVAKGHKSIAPILGFFEVLIWIMVIGKIMSQPASVFYYIAYAAGFASGNYVGLLIEERIAVGTQLVRVMTKQAGNTLLKSLNDAGFGATLIVGEGGRGKVNVIYTIVQRNNMKKVLDVIHTFSPKAFYTIEDVRDFNAGIFPTREIAGKKFDMRAQGAGKFLRRWRSGK